MSRLGTAQNVTGDGALVIDQVKTFCASKSRWLVFGMCFPDVEGIGARFQNDSCDEPVVHSPDRANCKELRWCLLMVLVVLSREPISSNLSSVSCDDSGTKFSRFSLSDRVPPPCHTALVGLDIGIFGIYLQAVEVDFR